MIKVIFVFLELKTVEESGAFFVLWDEIHVSIEFAYDEATDD